MISFPLAAAFKQKMLCKLGFIQLLVLVNLNSCELNIMLEVNS